MTTGKFHGVEKTAYGSNLYRDNIIHSFSPPSFSKSKPTISIQRIGLNIIDFNLSPSLLWKPYSHLFGIE